MTDPIELYSQIRFKHDLLREEWICLATPQMQALTLYVARWLLINGGKTMIITNVDSADPKSPHHYGCAIDFRTHQDYYPEDVLRTLRIHINHWFPNPGKTTLCFHGEGMNYHGHLQTPTWVLTYPNTGDPEGGPDHTN